MKATTTQTSPTTRRPAGGRKTALWRKYLPHAIGLGLVLLLVNALRPQPLAVEIGTVKHGPLTLTVLEEGKTRIRHRYIISPPIAGYLNRVALRQGDRIEAGKTVLATIQPQPASFLDPRARAEAEARVKAAEATKMQRETQIERATAALDLANKELVRARELKKSGAIATRDWDTAENQVTVLTRELHTAEFGRQVADFELMQAKAALTQAENPGSEKVEPMKIVSPIDGYVLNVYEESARMLAAGTQIMEVGDTNDMESEIELLSSDAVGVHPGADVSIEEWGGDAPLRGKVTVVEPGGYTKVSSLGVEEQRVKVRVGLVDPLPPGAMLGDRFRVEARIVTWHSDDVLQVPTGALFRRGGDWMTFVFENGKAHQTKVEVAHNNGVAAEVRAGLKEGQRVLVHPPDAVAEGSAVKARE
ncbi:efflux transporter, RND family, MFP subunit [Chthoniobacter flavus Ellin428]|uniref:Efflux transporter, RND family, MFP subunit n=1 Tax=Chthoniobacter flavus Ellin428 TaxID=497964 RepID=B4D0K3_9BACT|nr:HlyD family efflux transporter periplasmic adaptor subunit [Chthoniobacter flavus]EDY19865.1 efflux transporter, RND family, MFP subunit [Chthoniobacter flavus Ellin428]TCO91864.1 HlyD family secretion protein [Chthoniobacter flavus]